ncbi:hypothetical protein RJT34_24114 [Clitoria ternatea]|uniref:Uncharacterized protein n=1 Tax=Clitoria ternatea TaxID=43366 RepID=A0AAN9IIZ3_CLITE
MFGTILQELFIQRNLVERRGNWVHQGRTMEVAATINYLASILFLSLIIKGSCECSLNNVNIGTARSGREIGGKPEWNVSVKNNCSCALTQIKLSCKGFQSTETVSPAILSVEGDTCLLINGNPLGGFASVRFSYAWDPPFILMPASATVVGSC